MSTSVPAWYPLLLSAPVRTYAFGARLIADRPGKAGLPAGRIAETWEYSAYPGSESTVLNGAFRGLSLQQLAEQQPDGLIGRRRTGTLFPLLGKFLDASGPLPVHLHADDATARELHGADNGKTEAWHILAADEGATVLAGVKPGIPDAELRAALTARDYDAVLRRLPVSAGDTVYVPGGVLHSFGPGTLVFEIQQTSDLAQSVEPDDVYGNPLTPAEREANITATLRELRRDWLPQVNPGLTFAAGAGTRTLCAASHHFALERWTFSGTFGWSRPEPGGFTALTNIGVPLDVSTAAGLVRLERAESCIVPAGAGRFTLDSRSGAGEVLACYVPDLEMEVRRPLRAAGFSCEQLGLLGGVPL